MDTGFVYKWYDTSNDMYYIGSHKGDVNDGYIGSGTYFLNAYRKRKQSFFREILYIGEHYRLYEKTILEYLDAQQDYNSYNLINNSSGGGHFKGMRLTKKHKQNISNAIKGENNPNADGKASMKPVYSELHNIYFESRNHAAKHYGISGPYCGNMINGKKKNKYGLKYISKQEHEREPK
jgi:hypothetical protein